MLQRDLHIFLSQCTSWIGRRHNIYLMLGRVKSAIGSKQPIHERGVILPIVNLLLERVELAAHQVKFQQTTWQQMKQTWGLNWGPQRWFGDVHPHRPTGYRCGSHIERLTLLSQPRSNIMITSRGIHGGDKGHRWRRGNI